MFRELDSVHLVLHPELGETLAIMNYKIPRTANSGNIRIIFFRAFRIWPCIVPPQGAPAQWRDLGGFSQQLPTGCVHWLGILPVATKCFRGFPEFPDLWFLWILKTFKRQGSKPENVRSTYPLFRWCFFLVSSKSQNYISELLSLELNLGLQCTVQWT